ncbi:serine/arginine-rich splicing factor RS2Z33-like [Nylanderia fulva]|uniref:serine/arginine-rich splicing factor RS2Z33-like n=1 Tax=Nylanderia fulva TaxID=613905 RepID=UPI0010FB5616|nr:serine/arginine-rich splicing factor RS2Z33-like [Nylanderia fulva]
MAWVRCPIKAANIVAKKAKIQVGWAQARVEILEDRPLQCYKCLEGGHVRARCPNKADRSGKCYRCGQEGHEAKTCEAPVHCAVCGDKNLPANHRTGGKACKPVQKGRRGIPLAKAMGAPKESGATRMEVEPLESVSPTQNTQERPKEQRPPRAKGGRKIAEEGETPSSNQGVGKRQRLKEELGGENADVMEIASEGGTRTKMVEDGR